MNKQKITKRYSSAIKQAAVEGIAQGLYSKSERYNKLRTHMSLDYLTPDQKYIA